MKDYYRILQVHPEAEPEVLNNAYRTLVRQYHPDLFHSQRKEPMNARMRDINEAYDTLSNPHLRTRYNARYKAWQTRPQAFWQALPGLLTLPPEGNRSWMRLLSQSMLWFAGSYLLFRWLLKPLLMTPLAKLLLWMIVIYAVSRFFIKSKPS